MTSTTTTTFMPASALALLEKHKKEPLNKMFAVLFYMAALLLIISTSVGIRIYNTSSPPSGTGYRKGWLIFFLFAGLVAVVVYTGYLVYRRK